MKSDGSDLEPMKPRRRRWLVKPAKPCPWILFKAVERFVEAAHAIWLGVVDET
jgi:hypothetical protein